jgi:hypothetical protein
MTDLPHLPASLLTLELQTAPETTRAYAELFVRSLLMTPGLEDWRGWTLHVRDELGTPILDLPFASLLGKPH